MNRVIVFGDLPIATKVAKFILEHTECILSAVVIGNDKPKNNDPWSDELLFDFAMNNKVKIMTLSEISNGDEKYDIGISCRFSKIIKKSVIEKFDIGIVNFHGGLLPEFAGLYSVNHTLLCGSSLGGGTLHWIDEGIDTGNIIKRCEFEIENDTAISLFKKTQIALFSGFIESFEDIISGCPGVEMSFYIEKGYPHRYFDKDSLNDIKFISVNDLDKEMSLLKIRALYFPPHEPAYTIINGFKIYLTPEV